MPERDAKDGGGGAAAAALTLVGRGRASIVRRWHEACNGGGMHIHLADAGHVADAAELIAAFGESAALEASIRAGRSRDVGNHIHFCRWRQVERLIDLLASREVAGTVH